MPLRSASSSTKSTALGSPYSSPRRPSGQPRTSRMQYSACGACRMRRVRCDLKDQPYSGTGQPQCGNCTERGLRCIDEFADVKAVKLLRRGRRLQQVEAVYGKAADEDGLYGLPVLTPTLIAKLKPDFFSSSFFHRLFIQHPIIDPTEFLSRFFEFSSGNHGALGIAGQLIAMILVVWGSSFGVNEYGIEDPSTDFHTLHARRESTNELVREILQLVDMHGILRKPSFDGVRAVMLLLPLTEDVLNPTERLVIHEMLVAHVYTLCSLGSPSSIGSAQSQPVDTLVRARVFWYTHIVEGITSGLRGGRIVLSDDDLVMFNKSINVNIDSSTSRALQPLEWWSRFSSAPILLAGACRTIHSALTGPRARQDPVIDHKRIFEIWNTLDRVRSELEALRVLGRTNIPIVHDEDVERYCDGWQIFIFECHSRIRESLKQHMLVHPDRNGDAGEQCSASSLIQSSEARFRELAHYVAAIVKRHVVADSQFFEFDSTLACSGCFFAAFLLAGEGGSDDEVSYCLQALKRMRWVYSDAEDKERTVAMAWEARKARASSSSPSSSLNNGDSPDYNKLFSHTRHAPPPLAIRSLPTSTLADLPGAGANFEDGNWLTPPNSAGSSTQSFHGDARGPSSPHSSPLSVSSRQASGCGSPLGTTEFVAPGLLHPSSYSPLPLPPDDGARVEAFLYQPGVASYQIHGPQAGPGLTSIQSPHSGLAIGLPHAASPHALVSGNGSPSNMPNANTRFESHAAAPTFDPRVLGFPSDPSHTLSGVSDALEQAFNLSGNFF